MASALKIPDLRFEQSFMRSLHSNAVSVNSTKKSAVTQQQVKRENEEDNERAQEPEPLPVNLTPSIVIYTIIKDQLLMPFVQGLAMTSLLMICKPLLYRIFLNGRELGTRVFSSLGLNRNGLPKRAYNMKKI